MEGVETVSPPSRVIDAFEALISPFMQTIRANVFQSCGLGELCAALLPQLFSGELRVLEAEITQEELPV